MDTFSQNRQEPARPGKPSPFADSPYETVFAAPLPAPNEKKHRTGGSWLRIIAVCCVILMLISCYVSIAATNKRLEQAMLSLRQRMDVLQGQLDGLNGAGGALHAASEGMTPGQIYRENAAAVVCVLAYGTVTDMFDQSSYGGSSGSGFLISQDGYVVTNHHVIDGMDDLYVRFPDGSELSAELVGSDYIADVALLKVDGEDFPFVTLGSSDALQVGEQVVAIGYPLESVTPTLTVGYISAKDQVVDTDGSVSTMLQTDAAINSGNSGGPLFNTAGQVIGITTAKFSGYSSTGVSIEGMGLATPMDDVVGMISDLQEYGYISGAYLGIQVRDVDSYVQMFGLPAGAYVDEDMPGMAADRGGIRTGDVITALGGYSVNSVSQLYRALWRIEPGQDTSVTVWRNGQEILLTVVPDEKPVEQIQQSGIPEEYIPDIYEPDWPFDSFGDFFDSFFGAYYG